MEFYAAPAKVFRGQKLKKTELLALFRRLRYRPAPPGRAPLSGEYAESPPDDCPSDEGCVTWRNRAEDGYFTAVLGPEDLILDIVDANTGEAVIVAQFEPEVFGQFFGGRPILKTTVDLSEVPAICLNALIAIEDSEFLHHRGISPQGIARAFVRNIAKGRIAEGGSTITQQLIKNYFLTSERTFTRKAREIVMAMVVEGVASKDEILQAYINEIYMGQNGPFEVRGYAAAAAHYFAKDLRELSLTDCALLAALVNGPGLYDPFRKPEKALQRRAAITPGNRDGD
jgi:penicillin-binding protein 1B